MMARQLLLLLLLAALALAPCACRKRAVALPTIYEARGIVRELRADAGEIVIAHEEIPGYMAAMTMPFDVKDARELDGLRPGDAVAFRVLVTADDGWIDRLTKRDAPREALLPVAARVPVAAPVALGDLLPDQAFANAGGRPVRFSDFRGQAVAFTFFFTRCPYPDFCPRLSKGLAETQALLKARSDAPKNWHLASITIDPEYDTPERLQTYAAGYGADPAHWEFLTAPLAEVTTLGERFGLDFWRSNPNEPITHNTRTVVLDTEGRVRWIATGTDWKPEMLATQIDRASR